jgi:hypothetical protein
MQSQGINYTLDASGNVKGFSMVKGPNTVLSQAATDFWGEYILAK